MRMNAESVGPRDLAALSGDDANVSRNSVSSFDLHQVPHHQLVGIDLVFLAVSDHHGLLVLNEAKMFYKKNTI